MSPEKFYAVNEGFIELGTKNGKAQKKPSLD
jgi:hypothetical protein